MFDLTGKVALVTGGGSGIGQAMCVALAQAGACVAVVGRTLAKLNAVAEAIRTAGGDAITCAADVGRSPEVQRVIASTVAHFGGLDILVNNAGISPVGRVTDISEAEWDDCLRTDLSSVFLAAKYAIPHMQRRTAGVILNVAGTFGLRGATNKAAYCAAKAGVVNLTRSIALDYARDNIRCNVICPGFIDTPLTEGFNGPARDQFLEDYQPLRGMTTASEVATLAVYLASDAAKMVTGQPFVIDAGQQAGLF